MKLTDPRRRVLDLAATFTGVACSNVTDEDQPCVSTRVAADLAEHGLVELRDWNGRTWCCHITDAGRAALEAL